MFNKVILIGNLTRDIELRHTQNGLAIAHTGIATNRRFKAANGEDREEVLFIDLSFFGRTAEISQQYLHRGSRIMVEGRLKLEQWTAQDGSKRSKHSITVEGMKMLDGRREERREDSFASSMRSESGKQSIQVGDEDADRMGRESPVFDGIDEEDIPF
jgi:single-strand DNA-binding protein